MIDSHVHFWDPRVLDYPWLQGLPALNRPFLPADYSSPDSSNGHALVFVEANCRPDQYLEEGAFVERLANEGAPIAGIVAFADMTCGPAVANMLDAVCRFPHVCGVRHNIQGQPRGFCLSDAFVTGVRSVGEQNLTFDLCITHDQLADALELVRRCPATRFVLDHCAKPAIRGNRLDPWRDGIARLAREPNVVACKLSGLLTEAMPGTSDADLVPYANAVVNAFGVERMMYGSDWPVLTVAGDHRRWYDFTQRVTADWSDMTRRAFYHDNAIRVYGL
jgi:L-fuconolactonase